MADSRIILEIIGLPDAVSSLHVADEEQFVAQSRPFNPSTLVCA
jgi:hypothetical protein